MQYAVLIYSDPARWAQLSKEEHHQIHRACGEWHEQLVTQKKSVHCLALEGIATATTVREQAGKAFFTDGPFAETREVLGGLELIECSNLDEALGIARAFPGLRAGLSVEVRPLKTGCVE